MLAPLVQLLVANGVTYPQFTAALKVAFLRAAHAELEAENKKTTDSAVSLRSGVHRKDVRSLTADGSRLTGLADRAKSLPDEVFMRWTNDPRYLDADGLPKVLPLRGRTPEEVSFEMLSQSVSSDFHLPRLQTTWRPPLETCAPSRAKSRHHFSNKASTPMSCRLSL